MELIFQSRSVLSGTLRFNHHSLSSNDSGQQRECVKLTEEFPEFSVLLHELWFVSQTVLLLLPPLLNLHIANPTQPNQASYPSGSIFSKL